MELGKRGQSWFYHPILFQKSLCTSSPSIRIELGPCGCFGIFVVVFFEQLYCPIGISPMWNSGCFHRESQLRQIRATQPILHVGCFSVSIIHQTLTWTKESLTCTHMLKHVIAHRGVQTLARKSALKVDSGKKISCCTGKSNLHKRCAGPMLY